MKSGRYAYSIYIMQAFGLKLSDKIHFEAQFMIQLAIVILLGGDRISFYWKTGMYQNESNKGKIKKATEMVALS